MHVPEPLPDELTIGHLGRIYILNGVSIESRNAATLDAYQRHEYISFRELNLRVPLSTKRRWSANLRRFCFCRYVFMTLRRSIQTVGTCC